MYYVVSLRVTRLTKSQLNNQKSMISAQYRVNCLEEDHEPRLRPMNDLSTPDITHLFFIDSAQAGWKSPEYAHTRGRFGYSAPRKQQKAHPQYRTRSRLNRRQRCTHLQLRSGHCHLMQDCKHRVLGEPSDICRLWSFTTRCDTRLTCHQRIYGGIRWDQFVRLATSTTGTLTDLTTDLVVANNIWFLSRDEGHIISLNPNMCVTILPS